MITLAHKQRAYERLRDNQGFVPDSRREKYAITIDALLKEGYTDRRQETKRCNSCNKKCVGYERLHYVLKDDEVFVVHQIRDSKLIHWKPRCRSCELKYQRLYTLNNNENCILKGLCASLKRHMDGTPNDRKDAIKLIREKSRDKCASCGIRVIFRSKCGWRQVSITDKYPNLRHNDNPIAPLEDMVIVCLACQWFQHDLSWEEFLLAIKTIATYDLNVKNDAPFTREEIKWIRTPCNVDCLADVRNEVANRDGRHCVVTNVEVVYESGHWNTASFDRDDSSIQYFTEQTRIVCKHINFVKKMSITNSEMELWLKHLRLIYMRNHSHQAAYEDTFLHALFE